MTPEQLADGLHPLSLVGMLCHMTTAPTARLALGIALAHPDLMLVVEYDDVAVRLTLARPASPADAP